MNLKGVVTNIFETETFDSGFQKRVFVIETDDKYPQKIKFETLKDKCVMLNSLRLGDVADVSFDVRGNEYNDKFYVNLVCWNIKVDAAPQAQAPQSNENEIDPPF